MCNALKGALRPGGRRFNTEPRGRRFISVAATLLPFRGGGSTEGSPMLKSLAVRRMRPLGV